VKPEFLIEFLSILSRRLSSLAGELPQFLKGGKGMEGGNDVCKSKSLKTYLIKISSRVRAQHGHFYDLRVPISDRI